MIFFKVSDDFSAGENIFQIQSLQISEDLFGVGTMSFVMDTREKEFLYLQELKKIEFFFNESGRDYPIFSGYIYDISFDFFKAKIEAKSDKHWLKNKIIFAEKNYSSANVKETVQALLDEANARMESHEMQFSLACPLSAVFTADFPKGTNYFEIFDAIATATKSEWTAKKGVIYFQEKLGEAKDFTLLSLENSPSRENVSAVSYKRTAEEIGTSLLGVAGENYFTATASSPFPRVEKFITLENGEGQTELDAKLDEMKTSRNILEITPSVKNFGLALGDEISVKIERDNEIFNYSDTARILGRKIEFIGATPKITLELSKVSRKIPSPKNLLANFDRRIAKLER